MVIPFVKLGALALKTLSKPLANVVKRRAKSHPRFRETIINFAQSYHKLNVGLQRRLYGYSTNVDIKPLIEERAVETAADLVGEVFVFSVAGGIVVAEYTRSTMSEARKEEKRKQEKEALRQKDLELEQELETLKERLDALEKAASDGWIPRILRGTGLATAPVPSPQTTAKDDDGKGDSSGEGSDGSETGDEDIAAKETKAES
eukprot:TRINITY_DN18209_c0_g1_i1.p1 TRINITY_DN18209_c0_g1~~TRINITY_DN18209_c0_g1_i1.p1  ORF type:complete len:204 (+),score=40.73 TRINITY_DN18209_c0_g1_i1:326-937(+)